MSAAGAEAQTSKLAAIQVLRAAAALSVAAIHLEHEAKLRAGNTAGRVFPWEAGVDVFFVISGFVMVYASGRLFGQPGGARAFLARRVARIVPLYWLTTTAFLLVLMLRPGLVNSAPPDAGTVLASYLFIPVSRPNGLIQPVYSLGWTLNYEMFFYTLLALAIGLPRRRAVAAVTLALAGLVAAGLLLGPLPQPLGFWTDSILVEFALGMGLGLLRAEGVTLPLLARLSLAAGGLAWLAGLGGDAVIVTGLPQAVLFALPATALVAACGLARPVGSGPDPSPSGKEPGLVPEPARGGWPARIGEALGDASYAIYLLHPFAIRAMGRAVDAGGLGGAVGPWGFAALGLAATLAVSLAVHRWVERPLTAALRRGLGAAPDLSRARPA